MATLGTRNLTMMDIAKRMDPAGKVDTIVEILNQKHEILDDANVVVCNDGTSHKTTIRTGIPTPTWKKFYKGVLSTKSSTAQVVDSCGMLKAIATVDADLVDASSDKEGVLLSEVAPHLEGMRQEAEHTLIYGDTTLNPEEFHGLDQRYNVKDGSDETLSSYNVIGCGGSTNCTDIWLIGWGDTATSLIIPQNMNAMIKQTTHPRTLFNALDGSGQYPVYQSEYDWNVGLTVRDWKANGRLCNISVAALAAQSAAADLVSKMIELQERVQEGAVGVARWSWLMHPRLRTYLRLQMLGRMSTNTNVDLTFDNVAGRKVLSFGEIPIRASRKVLLTQTAI